MHTEASWEHPITGRLVLDDGTCLHEDASHVNTDAAFQTHRPQSGSLSELYQDTFILPRTGDIIFSSG